MKLLRVDSCLWASARGNSEPQTALGEGLACEPSDRSSTLLSSIHLDNATVSVLDTVALCFSEGGCPVCVTTDKLETALKRCSDGHLTDEYQMMLDTLDQAPLTKELVDYLCNLIVAKRYFWEIRFAHLRPLLLNPTAVQFDLKSFYEERFKQSRRLCMRMYFMRGYAMYASEQETTVMCKKFEQSLRKGHDYIDYMDIMSEYGMQYLVREYGYSCFQQAWQTAKEEYMKIHPYLRGHVTADARLRHVMLLSDAESMRRHHLYLQYLQSRKKL